MGGEKVCMHCGKKFIPTFHITRQKLCPNGCRLQHNNAKRYYKGVPVNVCPECGERFSTYAKGDRKYCNKRFSLEEK